MDEQHFYQRPWFYGFFWIVVGGGFYAWQIWKMGGLFTNLAYIIIDGVIFGVGMFVWLAFFAQFVLPVRTFVERQKIFDRLLTYLSGGHGPAIFIENGRARESHGERKKKGPGVLWLDSASAAVTRTATSFKQTLGPGVHFTKKDEFIASTIDLHAQSQGLGPRESENPFLNKTEEQSDDEFGQIQKRRMEVSAWTRDGIEIVPNISVLFKIDAAPAKDEQIGSRFGFDAEAVRKAITGEGINPAAPSDTPRHRVAWNQLPALIAADLWREYLSKFTLAELFEASQPGPVPPLPPAPAPGPADTLALMQPITPSSGLEKALAGMFRELNIILARIVDRCERTDQKTVKHVTSASKPKEQEIKEPKPETALQTINRMIKARMTEAKVTILDDTGQAAENPDEENTLDSPEYDLLARRGIKVMNASVSNLRFPPNIEDQLVRQWSTTWLDNANAERGRIDRLRGFVELSGQVEAVLQYTQSLSSNLLRHRPSTQKDTLKILMLRSRDELVRDDRLHRRASMEREELEELIQWVERNGL